MKILIVQESDWLKRGPHQQHHLADRISLRGHQVRVIDYDILWREHDRRELYSRRRVFGNICKVHQGAKVTVIRPGIIKVPVLGNCNSPRHNQGPRAGLSFPNLYP
jgi:hypothetical protein